MARMERLYDFTTLRLYDFANLFRKVIQSHSRIVFTLAFVVFYFILSVASLSAQISPGDLSKAHSALEGISNCTKCHTLGEKVSNDKCLDCHKALKSRINQNKGYHVSKEVKGKECASCHSDHHGLKFEMIRFDEKAFNHQLTGYTLTGAHKKIDCRECHKPDFVSNSDLKKNKKTYLGLDQKCASCHEDFHQKTLSNNCASCHNTDAFSPAANFNHDKTKFALAGKHKTVECVECHKEETRNGKKFQQFAGVAFNTCTSCHDDPHKNKLGTACSECHTEQSFDIFKGMNKFNHNKTKFALKGKHKQVDCAECHKMDAVTPLTVFQDRLGIATSNCAACHKDVHENKFGNNCAECHNENSFHNKKASADFDHDKTGFVLAGKHEVVDCKKCHKASFTDPLPHNTCASCHTDYHDKQFAQSGKSPDCAQCHTVDGFLGSLYTIDDHNKSKFRLEGAHVATPCFACHKPDAKNKWNFRNIGERCVDCHEDVHKGYISEKYYPGQSCEKCHVSDSWQASHFNHDQTNFKLLGAHAQQSCMACHGRGDISHDIKKSKFIDLSSQCNSCHADVHNAQFAQNGETDCARCHGFDNWQPTQFNHDQTAFKLEGKHAGVACEKCHKEIEKDGQVVVQYKLERFECVDCHQ
ncbi:MAG: hypothetical protein JNK77_16055 [Saprospiraceae bacterium]|nr:hypothetical protein [Saprospiraceae bacterium]